jgi:protease PrsW
VYAIDVVLALVPVVAFLSALSLMDSFRLVRPRAIAGAMAYGALAAGVSLAINQWLLHVRHVPAPIVSRYVAPIVEETAKAALLVALIATARVAFLVDAAVQGFAVGTGFALVENLWYLGSLSGASTIVWIVRGLGTAVLQGGTTTIFAIVSRALADRSGGPPKGGHYIRPFVPGWLAAVAIHAAFNQRWLPAVAEMLVILIVLPLLVLAVFERSERATRDWIGAGLDLDIELLALMGSESFAYTRFGRYLRELRARMPGPVVADMFCLLRLELELAVEAKALLLAREAGLEVPVSDDLEASLAERDFLQQSIGTIGLLALKPLQITSDRDRWHRHLLQNRLAKQ